MSSRAPFSARHVLACPATLNGAAAAEVLLPPPEWNNGIRPPKEGTSSTLCTILYMTGHHRTVLVLTQGPPSSRVQYVPTQSRYPSAWLAITQAGSACACVSQPASQSISQSVNAASWVISASPSLPCLSPSCVKQGPDRRLQLVSRTEILYIHILKSTGRHTSPPPPSPASQENTLHSCGGALRCIAVR